MEAFGQAAQPLSNTRIAGFNLLDLGQQLVQIGADDRFMHQQKFIERIMEYLHEEIGVQASPEQQKILSIGVGERVGGIIIPSEFEEKLVLPFHMGGAAFREQDAYLISRHLEKLIAQGAYKLQANELVGAHS